MDFGNELCNGNKNTAVSKYQWQFKADKCLFLGTGGNGNKHNDRRMSYFSAQQRHCVISNTINAM
jgi:hypothetical protein